jgi:hypothetical protein
MPRKDVVIDETNSAKRHVVKLVRFSPYALVDLDITPTDAERSRALESSIDTQEMAHHGTNVSSHSWQISGRIPTWFAHYI